jgi:hypothetical protein
MAGAGGAGGRSLPGPSHFCTGLGWRRGGTPYATARAVATTDVRAELSQAAEIVLTNRRDRAFIKAVRTFGKALEQIQDAGPLEYSHQQLVTIRDLGERVAIEIDDRIDDADDSDRIQQELTRTVSTIRRTVSELHAWERQSLPASASRDSNKGL